MIAPWCYISTSANAVAVAVRGTSMAFAKHSFGGEWTAIKGRGPARVVNSRHVIPSCVAEQIIHGKTVAVVGCGRAALAATAQMATLGGVVQLFALTEGSSSIQRDATSSRDAMLRWPILVSTRAAEELQATGICSDLGQEHKCATHCVHSRLSML